MIGLREPIGKCQSGRQPNENRGKSRTALRAHAASNRLFPRCLVAEIFNDLFYFTVCINPKYLCMWVTRLCSLLVLCWKVCAGGVKQLCFWGLQWESSILGKTRKCKHQDQIQNFSSRKKVRAFYYWSCVVVNSDEQHSELLRRLTGKSRKWIVQLAGSDFVQNRKCCQKFLLKKILCLDLLQVFEIGLIRRSTTWIFKADKRRWMTLTCRSLVSKKRWFWQAFTKETIEWLAYW